MQTRGRKGVQKSENFANVICVWSVAPFPPSFGRRKRNESSTRDPGRSGADQETVEEWMGKEDMLLNRGTPPSSLPAPGRGPKVSERTHKSTVFSESKLCLFVGNYSIPVVPSLSASPESLSLSCVYIMDLTVIKVLPYKRLYAVATRNEHIGADCPSCRAG